MRQRPDKQDDAANHHGHRDDGRSVIVEDGPARTVFDELGPAIVFTEVWEMSAVPADPAGDSEPTAHAL